MSPSTLAYTRGRFGWKVSIFPSLSLVLPRLRFLVSRLLITGSCGDREPVDSLLSEMVDSLSSEDVDSLLPKMVDSLSSEAIDSLPSEAVDSLPSGSSLPNVDCCSGVEDSCDIERVNVLVSLALLTLVVRFCRTVDLAFFFFLRESVQVLLWGNVRKDAWIGELAHQYFTYIIEPLYSVSTHRIRDGKVERKVGKSVIEWMVTPGNHVGK